MRIIFMGTPEFACPSLEAIINDPDLELAAIYTKEPKISGRGLKVQNSPIHNLALRHNLKIFTPKTLKEIQAQEDFQNLKADLAIVVAYGLILPEKILNGTKYGCINIHPSILPQWRGAAPMQRAIINGDKETGITIIKMNNKLDSGEILYQETMTLEENITYQSLEKTMSHKGANLISKIAKDFCQGKISPIKQDDNYATYAKKINKEECEINFDNSAISIISQINGLNGNLGAYFNFGSQKIKILSAKLISNQSQEAQPGKILDDQLNIQCNPGIIQPQILQRAGKKPTNLREFLLGFRLYKES